MLLPSAERPQLYCRSNLHFIYLFIYSFIPAFIYYLFQVRILSAHKSHNGLRALKLFLSSVRMLLISYFDAGKFWCIFVLAILKTNPFS